MRADTIRLKVKVPQEEIVFIDMVIKSYEGLAIVTVDHDNPDEIWLDVTEGTRDDVIAIMQDLGEKFPVEFLDK